jgi:hypothetical protein
VSQLIRAENTSIGFDASFTASEVFITIGGPEHSDYLVN